MEKIFTIKTALRMGWASAKANMLVLLGINLAYLLLSSLLSWSILGTQPYSVTYWTIYAISMLFSSYYSLAYTKMALQANDGEEPSFSAFGEALSLIIPYLLGMVLFFLIYLVGIILLIIPGIYFLLRIQFYICFIIEGHSPIESLKKSWKLTKGNVWKLLGQFFIYLGMTLLGLICLIVGVFVAWVWITQTYVGTFRLLQKELAEKNAPEDKTAEISLKNE